MTSIRSSGPSRLIGLAGPTSECLNRMDLPCFRRSLLLHAGGKNPGSTADRSRWHGPQFCLPLRGTGSATPITIDFGAMFPFTGIPAYNLPVYASQRPSPDATQDSVRGCSLGFAAAAISGSRARRACKAQPSRHPNMLIVAGARAEEAAQFIVCATEPSGGSGAFEAPHWSVTPFDAARVVAIR